MGCYSKHCGMELSSLHCGNGQNSLGGNGIYTVLSVFIILLFCLLARLPDCLMCLFFFFTRQRMYFHRVLSLSMCKESKDKLCYSDVLMFQTFICMFLCKQSYSLQSSDYFNLPPVIPINQVVFCYLLLIVTTLTIVKSLCHDGFYRLLEAHLQEYFHGMFLQMPVERDISGEAALCLKCHTDMCLSILGNLFQVLVILQSKKNFNRKGEMRGGQMVLNLSRSASAQP